MKIRETFFAHVYLEILEYFFKLRHHFSPSQLRQIYYNLFCPHLSYAIIAWNSPYKSNQKALRGWNV